MPECIRVSCRLVRGQPLQRGGMSFDEGRSVHLVQSVPLGRSWAAPRLLLGRSWAAPWLLLGCSWTAPGPFLGRSWADVLMLPSRLFGGSDLRKSINKCTLRAVGAENLYLEPQCGCIRQPPSKLPNFQTAKLAKLPNFQTSKCDYEQVGTQLQTLEGLEVWKFGSVEVWMVEKC